jgi:transcriptional regulator with PAS, ATPase and Fis domain
MLFLPLFQNALIAESLLDQFNRIFGKRLSFSDKTKKFIQSRDWPGNIRQLIQV